MKKIFQDQVEMLVYRTDSMEALPYKLKSSTNVFINEEMVSLNVALDAVAMEKHIASLL